MIDASAAAPFLLADEEQNRLPVVAAAMREGKCVAPALWPWEIGNILRTAVRSQRLKEGELTAILHDVREYDIDIETESVDRALAETMVLAARHTLTTYDAAYLELSLRLNADLATFDSDLRQAALAEGVNVHPAS